MILSGRSLFAEGIARRLRQYLQPVALEILDPRQADILARIRSAQPSVVILDATDSEVTHLCPLSSLLLSVPELKIICLDPQRDQLQIVTGEKRNAMKVRDLADVIRQSTRSRVSAD